MKQNTINVKYFARLKESVGIASEVISYSTNTASVQNLIDFLCERNGNWKEAFDGSNPIRAAVNQEIAKNGTKLRPGDEVAFFPPVTGG